MADSDEMIIGEDYVRLPYTKPELINITPDDADGKRSYHSSEYTASTTIRITIGPS